MSDQNQEELVTLFEQETPSLSVTGRCTKDKLKLFLDCRRRSESEQLSEHYLTELTSLLHGLIEPTLIDRRVLSDIASELTTAPEVFRRRVAKGHSPTPGQNGKLLLLVKKKTNNPEQTERSGNLRFQRTFDNIDPGATVARLYPETAGTDGIDVTGKVISAPRGKPISVKCDASLTRVPQAEGKAYETFTANIAGYLSEERGTLQIHPDLIVSGNVDLKSGDIDFVGRVCVMGNVMKNFRVIANGDVEIGGDVLGGMVESKQGSILIKGAVIGVGDVDSLAAGENLDTRMLVEVVGASRRQLLANARIKAFRFQNATVEAVGDIDISREAFHSSLRTKGAIRLTEGHLVGGESYAVFGVEAKTIGSSGESRTILSLCSDIEATSEFASLEQSIASHEEAEELLALHLGPLATHTPRLEALAPTHRERIGRALGRLAQVRTALAELTARKNSYLAAAQSHFSPRVNFLSRLFPGVEIRARDTVMNYQEQLIGPKTIEFLADEKTFVVKEFQALSCTEATAKTEPKEA